MKRMNGFLLCVILLAGVGTVTTISENALAGFCDRQDDPAQCEAGKIAAPGLSAYKAAKAATGADCEAKKAKALDQCQSASLNSSFQKGCKRVARRIKCGDPTPVVEPEPEPEKKPGKKPGKNRGKKAPAEKPPCGDGTCDWENTDPNLVETPDNCEEDCPCGEWCVSDECDTSDYEKCDLLGSDIPIPPNACVDNCDEPEAVDMQICENERGEYLIVPADIVCEKVERDGKPAGLRAPAKKVEKNTWISGVGNDMVIVIILLIIILLRLLIKGFLDNRRRKEEDEKRNRPSKLRGSGGSTPGSG